MEINKIYKGDCLELMPNLIPDKSIDMIFCDLPYGTTKCKWDSPIDLDKLWIQYERIIKDNGVILLFAQTPFDKVLGASNLKLLRYEWIWEKTQATGHLNAKKMPMKAHENILVFYKNIPTYNPQKTEGHIRKVSKGYQRDICIKRRDEKWGDDYLYGKETTAPDYDSTERFPRSVLKFKSDKQRSKLHPTQKPLALIEYLIKTYTNVGDVVLDNACGSGTTLLGAANLGRNYIGMEKEEKYFNISLERVIGE
jgi:site-specific DNA-methyltransferase (adenine-specific)